jgi:hypothetical protein
VDGKTGQALETMDCSFHPLSEAATLRKSISKSMPVPPASAVDFSFHNRTGAVPGAESMESFALTSKRGRQVKLPQSQ